VAPGATWLMTDLMTLLKFQTVTPLPSIQTDLTQRCREWQDFASNSQHQLFPMCYQSKVIDSPINHGIRPGLVKLYKPFCVTVELVVSCDIKK
jgi:hypothetical protein